MNEPRSRFCGQCGAPSAVTSGSLPSAASRTEPVPGEPERRHLTVVFADLVGSTPLSTRLDPEDLRDVIEAWRICATGLVVRHGGLVTRHMGDGILAFFGYPRAHETDAERAVRAGLAIVDAVRRLDTTAGPPGTLATRVGLATGVVIVGDLIGAGSSLEWSVVGETPNLASRLQTLTEPNTVIIDNVTRRITGGIFEYVSLGPIELKGIAEAVRPSVVLGERAEVSRFAALHAAPTPLVGREEEASLIERRWAKAQAGAGQVVVLVGEPGLGKSRLIAAFEEHLGSAARSVLRLGCSPHYQDTPLYPFIRYLETTAGFSRTDSPGQKLAKLQGLLKSAADLEEAEMALLADLLSLPVLQPIPDDRSVEPTKDLTFQALLRYIHGLATTTPLLAIVEDFHWADPTTTALLAELVNQVERFSALLIISSRPEKGLLWSSHPYVTTQLLNGLDRSQAAVLVRHITGERQFADEVVGRIVERAAGVPLFIEELTRSILDSIASDQINNKSEATAPYAGDTLPTSLNALLMAKLDQLGPGKEAAQASSVIGREFSFEVLQSVSGLPVARLEHALEELMQAGFIVPDGPPPNATYVFRHVLIQDAAYTSMLRARRRNFHLRYAEALERQQARVVTTAPEVLAAQFAEAGAKEKSIDYYFKAAARATGRFALTEIVGYLQKALGQIANMPASPATQQRELELHVARGRALIEYRGAGDEEVRASFERAHELCLVLGETKLLLHVHDGLANYHFAHSEHDKVAEYGERALAIGQKTGDRHALILAHRTRGYSRLMLGRFREGRRDFEQAIEKYEGEMGVTRDPKVSVFSALGICLTALGLTETGASMSHAAIRHAETLAHPISLHLGLRRACVQAMMQRDVKQVLDLSGRLLEMQEEYETFRGNNEGQLFSTWAQLQENHDPTLLRRLRVMLDQFERAQFSNFLPFYILTAAEVAISCNNTTEAETHLRRATELVEVTNERWCEAEIPRLRARLINDPAAAGRLMETAIAISREQNALLWELRAVTDLAKQLREQGQRETAYRTLKSVVSRITEGFAIPDFREAQELLNELS
jgi:class 3 adenylate cyclase/tetratricopeptide (TPR) repeat protein